jgi:hypothetical protein
LGRDFEPRDEPAVTPHDSLFAALGRMSGGGDDKDDATPRVCIVSESLARRLFGGANPLGRHLGYSDAYRAETGIEIVGVVKDVHHESARNADREGGVVYVPSWGSGAEARYLVVRTRGSEVPVMAAIRSELRAMDPNVAWLGARKLADDVNGDLRHERMIAYLCGCFGALALTLAAVGLYGVMAYAVARRTKEIGIRMALGARRRDVVELIVRESLAPVLLGVAIGTAGALAAVRLVAGLLFGVAPGDPSSFVVAASAMLAVALAAAALPARRGSRVEPLVALRYE